MWAGAIALVAKKHEGLGWNPQNSYNPDTTQASNPRAPKKREGRDRKILNTVDPASLAYTKEK